LYEPADRGGFFVVGDNVPVSVDSRHWKSHFVGPDQILGKVNLPSGNDGE
jgi:hypothetical protein